MLTQGKLLELGVRAGDVLANILGNHHELRVALNVSRTTRVLQARGAGTRRVSALHRADRVSELVGPVAGRHRHRHRHRGSQSVRRQVDDTRLRIRSLSQQQSAARVVVVLIVTMMQR